MVECHTCHQKITDRPIKELALCEDCYPVVTDTSSPVYILGKKFPVNDRAKFDSFLDSLPWSQDEFLFRGKPCKSPRETVYYGERDYLYSGITQKANPFSKELKYIANTIEKMMELPKGYFNACLLNKYRDGKDSISYHKDDEKDMHENSVIAVLSVGEERKFCLKNDKTLEVEKFLLEDLSISVMNPICQREYRHAILKELRQKNARISLTFRRMS